jgi:hypothetical protein
MNFKQYIDFNRYSKYFQQWWSVPLFLLVVSVATYGLLASKLGLYFDDWTAFLALHAEIDLWEFYQSDRPFSAWTFLVFEPILGLSPLNWQIFSISLRWLTAWGVFWILHQLWPGKRQQVFWMALLFTVYPVFTQQSISVAYSQHFITYALFALSLGAMLAMLSAKRPVVMFIIAIVSTALHLLTMEYFWGLELLRPAVLWLAISRDVEKSLSDKIKHLAKSWAPYMVVLLAVAIWRFVLVDFEGGDTNSLRLLSYILAEPVNGIRQLFSMALRDLVVILFSSWYGTLQPDLIDLKSPSLIFAWGIGAIVALMVYFVGRGMGRSVQTDQAAESGWLKEALGFGVYAIFVGMLPGWMVQREISRGLFSDRIALPAMIGAGIVLVCLVVWISSKYQTQLLLISIFVGLAAGAHFRTANEYRWEWAEQRQFYWQLYWRAPALEENTAILADGALFNFTGEHPTGSALNVLYSDRKGSGQQPYWFFEIDDNFYADMSQLLENQPIQYRIRNLKFDGFGHDNIVVWYDYPGSCVWVLSDLAELHPTISGVAKAAIPVSNLERILLAPAQASPPRQDVFGPEPTHTWCYYFEKASIAYQQADWDQIVELGHIVEEKDFEPNTHNKLEWYPFIEAYGRSGDWERAETLSINAFKGDELVQAMFCQIWADLEAETPASDERDAVVDTVTGFLECLKIP